MKCCLCHETTDDTAQHIFDCHEFEVEARSRYNSQSDPVLQEWKRDGTWLRYQAIKLGYYRRQREYYDTIEVGLAN